MKKVHGLLYSILVSGLGALTPAVAWGQATPAPSGSAAPVEPAPAPVAPPAESAAPAPEPPPPEVAPAPVEPTAAAEAPAPEAPAVPEAPAAEPSKFVITTGFGLRSSLGIYSHKPKIPSADGGNGFRMDELSVEPRFSGKVTDIVGWTANFQGSGQTSNSIVNYGAPPPVNGPFPYRFELQAMDLVAQLDFMPEFHMWFGRMLTPSDRSNFSGPWFMSPWNYPGSYFVGNGPYVGPRGTEEIGREVGTVVWGDINEGVFKYYAGVMDLDNTDTLSPLLTGRLGYAIIGKEPGFYGSSTYYGAQDILALGVGAQYQKQSVPGATKALKEFNADLLAEFNVTGVGTLTGELAYYNMDGPAFPVKGAFMGLASYTTEKPVGVGKIQPLIRFQNTMKPNHTMVDFWLSYVMKDYFAKLALGYTMVKLDDAASTKTNIVQFGFQIQQ